MHCPRCGATATVDQTFCRSCGFSLEKIAELLGEQTALESASPISETARLRERQKRFESLAGVVGMGIFALLLLLTIIVVFSTMILKGGAIALAGLLIILLMIGAGVMGAFQTYSKVLKGKLAQTPIPSHRDTPSADTTGKLELFREPVPSVAERTTSLLVESSSKAKDQ